MIKHNGARIENRLQVCAYVPAAARAAALNIGWQPLHRLCCDRGKAGATALEAPVGASGRETSLLAKASTFSLCVCVCVVEGPDGVNVQRSCPEVRLRVGASMMESQWKLLGGGAHPS